MTVISEPTTSDYNTAFENLTEEFKMRKLRHLICSPMGCVRDRIDLAHFLYNSVHFQCWTAARITVVSHFQPSFGSLQSELFYQDFNKCLSHMINNKLSSQQTEIRDTIPSICTKTTPDCQLPFPWLQISLLMRIWCCALLQFFQYIVWSLC